MVDGLLLPMTIKEQEAVTHRVGKKFEPDVERNDKDACKPVVVVVVDNLNKQSQSNSLTAFYYFVVFPDKLSSHKFIQAQ